MHHPTLIYFQTLAAVLLRRGADRLALDIDDDSGFTTVEKVVLTGIAVLLAVGVGAAMRGKVADLLDQINTSFE
jgi:4-amino-4-deoxy-L-arabinose transferase-like glycosyltransferase